MRSYKDDETKTIFDMYWGQVYNPGKKKVQFEVAFKELIKIIQEKILDISIENCNHWVITHHHSDSWGNFLDFYYSFHLIFCFWSK
jgi:hypothetical protein